MNGETKFDIDKFNDDNRNEYNYYKIYKEFLFHIVVHLKHCKYTYDVLKSSSVFNDKDDELYDFDSLINYYTDIMNHICYSGVVRRCSVVLNGLKKDDRIFKNIYHHHSRISPKLQKKENNEIIRSLIHKIAGRLESAELELRDYNDDDFCSRRGFIRTNTPEFQEFKKIKPIVSSKKTIFNKMRRDIDNRFINSSSKNYVECFGIGVENVEDDDVDVDSD